MAINPFEFPKGLSLAEHIQNLMDVFEGAFPLTPPLPALLDRAIEGIYRVHGWDTDDVMMEKGISYYFRAIFKIGV